MKCIRTTTLGVSHDRDAASFFDEFSASIKGFLTRVGGGAEQITREGGNIAKLGVCALPRLISNTWKERQKGSPIYEHCMLHG